MKNIKDIKIIIKKVEGREGEYIAYYTSDFLDATYSVYFRDLCFIKHKEIVLWGLWRFITFRR